MPEPIQICEWGSIQAAGWQSLLLGNGASIALHPDFCYPTLHGVAQAKGLFPTSASLFDLFGTTNFEQVLLACWYAERVNSALGTPSHNITRAYQEVRSALIDSVKMTHPAHANITEALLRAAGFASKFATVVSLNYDLTLYWAMLLFNEQKRRWFKDAFLGGEFATDWNHLRNPYGGAEGATMVFYPHGNLSLMRDFSGKELKASAANGDLLETITKHWSSGNYVPVFVSEGTSDQKLAAISRSRYLSTVEAGVISNLEETVVVYGWSFDTGDQHILESISRNPPKRIAVSVFSEQSDDEQQKYCHHVMQMRMQFFPKAEIMFFDSRSSGCWNNE